MLRVFSSKHSVEIREVAPFALDFSRFWIPKPLETKEMWCFLHQKYEIHMATFGYYACAAVLYVHWKKHLATNLNNPSSKGSKDKQLWCCSHWIAQNVVGVYIQQVACISVVVYMLLDTWNHGTYTQVYILCLCSSNFLCVSDACSSITTSHDGGYCRNMNFFPQVQ